MLKIIVNSFFSSTVTLFLVGNETSARSKWTKCVREGRRQEIHDNASRNLNEIMSRTFPLISCIYIRFKNVLAGKWVLLRIHSVGNINECVLQEYDGRATWWIMRSPTVQSYVDGGVSTKETISAFLSFKTLHGITILVSGFMVVDTITGILRIPGRESKLLHVLHNGELLGTYSSDVQHFWDKTRCNVDWEDKISSFEHWTVKKPRIGGVELYLFAPFGLVGCHLVCHQIPFQHWGINI